MSFEQKEYITDKFTVRLIEPNIIENIIHDHAVFDVEDAYNVKAKSVEFTSGEPYVFIGSKGEFSEITDEAKKVLAGSEITKNTLAKALLLQSLSDRIMANFYLKIIKPSIKAKSFGNREKALVWLREQLKEQG